MLIEFAQKFFWQNDLSFIETHANLKLICKWTKKKFIIQNFNFRENLKKKLMFFLKLLSKLKRTCQPVCGKPPVLEKRFAHNYDYNGSLDVLEGETPDYKCLPCYWRNEHVVFHVGWRENGTFSPSTEETKLKCHNISLFLIVNFFKIQFSYM